MGVGLWSSAKCANWISASDRYPQVIQAQGVNGLPELDLWYRTEFAAALAGRDPVCVTREELQEVTRWKMKRGVWRERNRILVAGNAPQVVQGLSIEAFAAVPDPRRPIAILSQLAGVGPATASAVLAAYRPDIYPFFDELVAAQIPGLGPVAFTPAYYQRYATRLRERANQLKGLCSEYEWTAQQVSQALWVASGGKAGQG
jgi:hypothetical protein